MLSYFRFRYNRGLRRFRRQFRLLSRWSAHYVQRHVYGVWRKLLHIGWRFYFVLSLMFIGFFGLVSQISGLNHFYLTTQPISGGIYSEGLVGEVRSINPILATSSAAQAVEKLVFSSLVQLDDQGQITGDVAESWTISKDAKTYTFHLRPNIYWQDGRILNAHDVVFTIGLIQNPDTRSPLLDNFKGAKATAANDQTLILQLPAAYPNFITSANFGILPQHLLDSTTPSQLQLSPYNTAPIGSGPFRYDATQSSASRIVLTKNPLYFKGSVRLDEVLFYLYPSADQLVEGYSKKQIVGFAEPSANKLSTAAKLPRTTLHTAAQPAYTVLFFNTKHLNLQDAETRRNISALLDRSKLLKIGRSSYGDVEALPINSSLRDPAFKVPNTISAADARNYLRQKYSGTPLTLDLETRDSYEYSKVAAEIKNELASANINVTVSTHSVDDLVQNHIRPRKFDLLLFGENIGANIDIYNFWHSSQVTDPGLNVSGYTNPTADHALESMRLAQEIGNRHAKENIFLNTWWQDAPAAILYSPKYLYFQADNVTGFNSSLLIQPADRFYNIANWAVRSNEVRKTIHNN